MTRIHEGEQAVQRRAGEGRPGWGSPMFDATIPGAFAEFLRHQHTLVLGATDDHGAVWASMLSGLPGFVSTADDHTVVVDHAPPPGDPLHGAFASPRAIGMLALQPQTRRRIRVNGTATQEAERLVVRTEQVLGNCPKYIQVRTVSGHDDTVDPGSPQRSPELTPHQVEWIRGADTFFIASQSPDDGADVSSRGGMPGFVTVASPSRLRWPDYTGNQFYMTLGNLHLNPASGLLFVDWERGHTLQLTGTARVDWDPAAATVYPGALRVVELDVEAVVQIDHASPLRWQLHEYSRFNPAVAQ